MNSNLPLYACRIIPKELALRST